MVRVRPDEHTLYPVKGATLRRNAFGLSAIRSPCLAAMEREADAGRNTIGSHRAK